MGPYFGGVISMGRLQGELRDRDSIPGGDLARVQWHSLIILSAATILGGLGIGASFSAGALLITEVTQNPAVSGLGATMNAVGAAIAGIPLARLAARHGRRPALVLGNTIAVVGAILIVVSAAMNFSPALFLGFATLGVATAVQLQSRFAAADLASPRHRARDLSLVVWSITIGAVAGPNLLTPGTWVGELLGVPGLAGVFVFTVIAQVLAGLVVWIGLRPDPLLLSRQFPEHTQSGPIPIGHHTERPAGKTAQYLVIAMIAVGHAVMVGLMAMTPLHLTMHGGSFTVVGVTISLHIAGMYALSPVFGILAGRFGAIPVVAGGLVLLAASAVGAAVGGSNVLIIQASLVLLGLGWGMVNVAGAALLTSVTPPEDRPKRQGQADTIMNAAGAIFGAVSGVIFVWGGFPALAAVSGLFILFGAYAVVRCGRELRIPR